MKALDKLDYLRRWRLILIRVDEFDLLRRWWKVLMLALIIGAVAGNQIIIKPKFEATIQIQFEATRNLSNKISFIIISDPKAIPKTAVD